ncbi:TIGR02117 family protein [Riemerella columbina]|uniref:TIGR02117 family protein n=1 Tax=Riemerella columbina TaxID=103810 RepID=UPI00266FB8B4|nr:TIGR02117 family protein [Riemerella columbina]WKS96119.1 TIGR02117 family protein [Riemerella columbina]
MKSIFRFLLKALGVLLGIVGIYILLSLLLPLIPVAPEKTAEPKPISIYILTNGVHTDLVVPTQTPIIDWSQYIPYENTIAQQKNMPYLGIGWGDKGFYLDTPEWSDLKFSTAFSATFGLGGSAMHCTYYPTMTPSKDCVQIRLTNAQYQRLVHYIQNQFKTDASERYIPIKTDAVYGKDDAFYEAKGRYNFTQTCNTWANNGLKACGQTAALWTPTDFGIFRHYRE